MPPVILPGTTVTALGAPDNSAKNEQVLITPNADLGAREVTTLVCPSFAEAAQADYFIIEDQAGTEFGFYLGLDGNNTPPSGPGWSPNVEWQVNIVTGDTAVQVAAKIFLELQNDPGAGPIEEEFIVVDNEDGTLAFTVRVIGEIENPPIASNSDDSGAGSLEFSVDSPGADSQHLGTYMTIKDEEGNSYHVWPNPDAIGDDPSPGSSTPIEVQFDSGASSASIASAMNEALQAISEFESNLYGTDQVLVRNKDTGNHADSADVDTGWSVTKIRDGAAAPNANVIPSPSGSPTQISNMPSPI